jgi:hypothetical protein
MYIMGPTKRIFFGIMRDLNPEHATYWRGGLAMRLVQMFKRLVQLNPPPMYSSLTRAIKQIGRLSALDPDPS